MKQYYLVEGLLKNNLGDVIQGVAAKHFLSNEALPIDREKMSSFNGEPGILIANGWYLHDYTSFPPSSNLIPLYISVHLSSYKILQSRVNRAHFKKFGPVGCRDVKTMMLFLLHGIPAWYSGCLTATISRNYLPKNGVKSGVYLVDNMDHEIPIEITEKFKQLCKEPIIHLSHDPLIKEYDFDDYVKRSENEIEKLFQIYQQGKLIITSKLHCALPCLALNVNVLFIHPNPRETRLEPYLRFNKIYSYEEVLSWKSLPNSRLKKGKLKWLQTNLIKHINYFVENHENMLHNPKNLGNIIKKQFSILLSFLLMIPGIFILKAKKLEK